MKDHVGEILQLKAKIGIKGANGSIQKAKVCLVNVENGCGQAMSTHEWVDYDEKRMKNLKQGDIITFTAIVTTYRSLDDKNNIVIKTGLKKIRNIIREVLTA